MQIPDWQWNEMQQIGTDFTDLGEIEKYDNRMASFRDVDAENREMLDTLNLPVGSAILDIGCGTGRFVRAAAEAGMAATAVDVSPGMLQYVRRKAEEDGLPTIVTQHAGFLTMSFPAATFDAAISGAVLHHLPDAWKLKALLNTAYVLKPGGQFILRDVVFTPGSDADPEVCFKRFAESIPAVMRTEAARHVAREFSTFDWIMQGLLKRAGFEILSTTQPLDDFLVYHCRKP